MKKSFFFASALLMLIPNVVNAQEDFNNNSTGGTSTEPSSTSDLKSKRGFSILPEAGEYALGISATGTLRYFGNMFNTSNGNTPGNGPFGYANSGNLFVENNYDGLYTPILLKKFVSSTKAYRLRLQLALNSNTSASYVAKDELAPDNAYPKYVTDKQTSKSTGFLIALGQENRRGKHRVQGVYGAEAYLGIFSASNSYNYGNPFSANFPIPTISNTGLYNNGARTVKETYGLGFILGVRPYLGVEYFFAPKLSIGGEFGYNVGASIRGTGVVKAERWNPATNSVDEIETEPSGSGVINYGLSIDNLNGSLNLLFHF